MTQTHSELWSKLEALDLNGNAQFSFSMRLAKENGWTPAFTQRVVKEYKRFLFLAATAGHPVSPSDEVDQAWHLHLVYTHLYWDELCDDILGFQLHHGPTKGGKKESAKFGDWYAKTIESYRVAFDEEPPADIWPDPAVRFTQKKYHQYIDLNRAWVIRKPNWVVSLGGFKTRMVTPNRAMLVGRLALVTLLLMLAGCAAPKDLNVAQWTGPEFLGAFWTLCVVGVSFAMFLMARPQPPVDPVFPMQPLDGYEVARLKGDDNLAVDVALAALQVQGAIRVLPDGALQTTRLFQPSHPFEREVLSRIDDDTTVRSVRGYAKWMSSLTATDQKLRDAGLLLTDSAKRSALWGPLSVILALMAIGALRTIQGMANQKPVGYLVLTGVVLLVFLIVVIANVPRRTKRGDLLLQRLEAEHRRTPLPFSGAPNDTSGYLAAGMVATTLFFAMEGSSAFPEDMRRAVMPPTSGGDGGGSGCSSDSGGGDSGGGDSGGGCGGGCGGCGGGGGD